MQKNAQKCAKIGAKLPKMNKNARFLDHFFAPPCVND